MLRTSEIRRAACEYTGRNGRCRPQQPAHRPQRRPQLVENIVETVALKLQHPLAFDGSEPVAEETRWPRPQASGIDRLQPDLRAHPVVEVAHLTPPTLPAAVKKESANHIPPQTRK